MDYDEQLSAAKFRAERDQARQECERLRARLRDSVPRGAYERERAAWLRQIRERETALRRRREHIKELEDAALERRMPGGMERPRFEDGEPVGLGERWEEDGLDESATRIDGIESADDGVRFENEHSEASCRYGERAKRPVLDANGVPIHEGDTVYDRDTGDSFEVGGFSYGCVVCTDIDARESDIEMFPLQLTHAKPETDTWERLEEDAGKDPCEYLGFDEGEACGKRPAPAESRGQTMARDLVRRAKALAERGQ